MSAFKVLECQVCNWIYDEAKGCPEEGLAPGTRWEAIPDDWCCPECGMGKDEFEMLEVNSEAGVSDTAPGPESQDENSLSSQAEPIIIIGTGMAGYGLIKALRRIDPDVAIVMYTSDDGALYSKPKLSLGLSANKTAAQLVSASAEDLAREYGIEINIHSPVIRIDHQHKCIHLQHGGSRRYSKLVLALGANAIAHGICGEAASKVHSINNLQDYNRFRTLLRPGNRVLVIGAGLIGSELADDLVRSGYQVSAVEPAPGPLASLLPKQASEALAKHLDQAGIRYHFGTKVECIEHDGAGVLATLTNGIRVQADLVLSAIGVRANTGMAMQSGIQCDCGIVVDAELQTSAEGVYAIGDCAQVHGRVLPYIAPMSAQVQALAKRLTGKSMSVHYDAMPIHVKTKIHPVVINPPASTDGNWVTERNDSAGVIARFVDKAGETRGYALTGAYCKESGAMLAECRRKPD